MTNIFISCRCCLCAICLQTTYIYALTATPPASLAAYHQYLQTRHLFRAKIAIWFELKRHVQVMATYATHTRSQFGYGWFLSLCCLCGKSSTHVWIWVTVEISAYDGTVITWPWSFLNTCHSHLMLRGGARIGRVWWKV